MEANGARLKGAGKVPRVALTSARPMGVESGAAGMGGNARSFPEGGTACVQLTATWFMKERTMQNKP